MSHTTTLAQQQRDLLHAIFTTNNIATQAINTPARGINSTIKSLSRITNLPSQCAASAQRSLQTAYPVIAQLIGDDAFEHLAHDFWAQHPPTRGDLAQWGSELSGFIATISALQAEPYLGDVAKAEWALHTAATATDKDADLATFTLLTEQDPSRLNPATCTRHSADSQRITPSPACSQRICTQPPALRKWGKNCGKTRLKSPWFGGKACGPWLRAARRQKLLLWGNCLQAHRF